MPVKKIFIEVAVIAAVSIVLGFAGNFINSNGVAVSKERPVAKAAEEATLADSTHFLQQPIVVDKGQVKRLVSDDAAILIDARLPEEYEEGHVPGAINVPVDMLGDFIDKIETLPKDGWIICYCDGPPCDKGKMLADELYGMEFAKVAYYDAGMDDWIKSEEAAR